MWKRCPMLPDHVSTKWISKRYNIKGCHIQYHRITIHHILKISYHHNDKDVISRGYIIPGTASVAPAHWSRWWSWRCRPRSEPSPRCCRPGPRRGPARPGLWEGGGPGRPSGRSCWCWGGSRGSDCCGTLGTRLSKYKPRWTSLDWELSPLSLSLFSQVSLPGRGELGWGPRLGCRWGRSGGSRAWSPGWSCSMLAGGPTDPTRRTRQTSLSLSLSQ